VGPAGASPREPAGQGAPFLSVAITAYNEERRLPRSLERIIPFLEAQPYTWEIVVDGSQDRTAEIVRSPPACARGQLRLLASPANLGKGAGVRRAVLAARGRYILFSDADFSTPIEEFPRLLARLEEGYHVVIGSRVQPDGSDMRSSQPLYRRLLGKLFHALAAWLVVPGIADTQAGFKAFVGSAAHDLFSRSRLNSIIFDVEVLYLAQRLGYRIAEVPVYWTNAGGSRMRITPGHAARVLYDLLCIPYLHRHARLQPVQRPVPRL